MEYMSTLFGLLGTVTFICTIIWPARGRTGRSPAMHHAAIVSCILWAFYVDGFLLTIVNIAGCVLELISLLISRVYNHRRLRLANLIMHATIFIFEAVFVNVFDHVVYITYDVDDLVFIKVSGQLCLAASILTSVLEMVYQIRRKSKPLLLFENALAAIANWFVWTIYAYVSSQRFLLISYLVGGFLGLLQLVIKFRADWRKVVKQVAACFA